MADRSSPNDLNKNLVRGVSFTTNPESSTSQSSSQPPPQHSSPKDDDNDPPPPFGPDLHSESPEADLALEAWVLRNSTYLTTIPWHRYPRVPVLSELWGYSLRHYRADVFEQLIFYTRAAGRRLTDHERDAALEPITRAAVAASYDRPVAIGLAAWGVARSWAKSGAREEAARTRAAAAADAGGATGHITHFSGAHQQTQGSATGGMGRVLRALLRRSGRASLVGLSCWSGYQVLWEPYRSLLEAYEVDTMFSDYRLSDAVDDMTATFREKLIDYQHKRRGQ